MQSRALRPQPLGTMMQFWKPGSTATAWRGHLPPARTIAAHPAQARRSLAAPRMHLLPLATAGPLLTCMQSCVFPLQDILPAQPGVTIRHISLSAESAPLNRNSLGRFANELICMCSSDDPRCNRQLYACAVPVTGSRGAVIMWMPSVPCCCSMRCHPRRSGALVGYCCRSWASEEQVYSLHSRVAIYNLSCAWREGGHAPS